MEKEIINDIMDKVKEIMKSKKLANAKIEYLLINKQELEDSIAFISKNEEDMAEINLKYGEIYDVYDWSYDIDEDFFKPLENEYQIGFISLEWNFNIWCHIEAEIEELEHKLGIQKYLKYCKDNNINKEFLEKSQNMKITDIMQYYNPKTDYLKIEDGQVQLSQDEYLKENEISYISFCLGYDLLNNKLSESVKNECDNVYDFCNSLAKQFVETYYHKKTLKSTYDNLKDWIEDNKDIIQSEYLFFTGKDNKIFLETGERCGDKVALVEHRFKDGTKEYIIAFHYEVDEKRVDWGYGVYYDNDLKKAKEDFEKVKAGESISDTFKNQNKKTEKNKELAGEIIEQFEELLAKHKIKIPNKNREGNEDESCIFGTDYYDLEDDIVDILEKRKG